MARRQVVREEEHPRRFASRKIRVIRVSFAWKIRVDPRPVAWKIRVIRVPLEDPRDPRLVCLEDPC